MTRAYDAGFRAGALWAADIAKAAASEVRERPRPKEFGEREQRASVNALEGLAAAVVEGVEAKAAEPAQ